MEELVRAYLSYLERERNYSPHTVTSYRNDLDQYAGFLRAEFPALLTDHAPVASSAVRGFLGVLLENGVSRKSVVRKLSTLRSFYKYLVRRGIVPANPAASVVTPKVEKTLPNFVDPRSMERILTLPDTGTFSGSRDAAMLELFYGSGLRLSELLTLTPASFDPRGGTVKVTGKGNKQRIVPVTRRCAEAMERYLRHRSGLAARTGSTSPRIFLTEKGAAMYPQRVYAIVRRYLREGADVRQQSPHVLRHSFATHLLDNGADILAVKELLGHESLSTTQVYTHVTVDRLKKVYRNAHPKATR